MSDKELLQMKLRCVIISRMINSQIFLTKGLVDVSFSVLVASWAEVISMFQLGGSAGRYNN